MRSMSMFGPMKNSSALTSRCPPGPTTTIVASSATSAGAVSDGLTATQRSAPQRRVLAVLPFGRIRVAGVAARAIAVDAVAVVPAARVLADVAADRARVADLRARDAARRIGQHLVAVLDHGASLDLRQRRQRADLDAAVRRLADAFQRTDAAEVDDVFRPLHPVLEPVEAVVAARQRPALLAEPRQSSTAPSTVSGW